MKLPRLSIPKMSLPVPGASSSAGLVLRPRGVEVFEARAGARGIEFTKMVSEPVARPDRAGDVSDAIQRALVEARLKTTKLGVCVAGQDVLLRAFSLPLLPKAEWNAAVQSEARKHIPFRTEELVWDFHATEQRATKRLDVVFVGIKADVFERVLGWLRAAGMTPLFVEPQSVSLARAAALAAKVSSVEYCGLVDLERDGGHIVIARDQVPLFTRDIHFAIEPPAGTADAAAPVSQVLGFMAQDSAPPASDAESRAPDPRADLLLSELRLSLDYFVRETPSASLSKLWLFGHESIVGSWAPWLSKQLGIIVELAPIALNQGPDRPVSLQHACAAGVTLRDQRTARVRIDFLHAQEAPSGAAKAPRPAASPPLAGKAGEYVPLSLKPVVTQVLAALLVLGLWKGVSEQHLSAARSQTNAQIRQFQDVGWGLAGRSKADLQQIQQQVARKLAFLQKTIPARTMASEKLSLLAQALPDGIWLESVAFTNRLEMDKGLGQPQLIVQGACYLEHPDHELAAISELATRLKSESKFIRPFSSADVGEILSQVDRSSQTAYKTFRLDYGVGKR